jgi:membrane-bound serine protease (ClpP class)
MMISLLAQVAPAAIPGREEIYFFVAIGLFGLAIILLVLELFVPSAGALAVMTGVSAVGSVASMFVYDVTWGGVYLAVLCAGSPIVLLLVFQIWSKTPIAHRMILKEDADGNKRTADDESSNTSVATSGSAAKTMARQLATFVGHEGVAVTTLRPIGFVRIDGARFDALAENGFISEGSKVKVIEVLEGQLKVREQKIDSSDA